MLSLVTGPLLEPIALQEAKDWMREVDTAQDTITTDLIRTAREKVETDIRRPIVTQTWRLTLDWFPGTTVPGSTTQSPFAQFPGSTFYNPFAPLELSLPPIISVSSIQYVDTAGTTQTWASTNWTLDTYSEPGRVTPNYGTPWPYTRDVPNAVTVTFIVGYVAPITAVNVTTDKLTVGGRTYANADVVRVSNSGGALPTPLAANTDYYVVGAGSDTPQTIQLSATSGGAAIDLTGAGTGNNFLGEIPSTVKSMIRLIVGYMYDDREPTPAEERALAALVAQAGWGHYG